MAYTALYRKWRPSSFDEVKGQDHIVRTLKNQIISERIGHAYLFCGTRGTGKTTVAKIFAKAVNCEHPQDAGPCKECEMCKKIASGSSLNVMEIDAASNNGVENIRDIREQVQYPPTEGRYRVYIIDEVHMLSAGAFNALLKTLEEPPAYVIFILATTEVNKIPITILSRCQRYDFKRITIDTIAARLKELTQAEKMDVEERALRYVAKAADGSMRDALSLLDQCAAFHFGETLSYENVLEVLGASDNRIFSELFQAVSKGKTTECIYKIDEMILQGRELTQFVNDFIWYMRNLLIVKTSEDAEHILDMSMDNLTQLREDAELSDHDTLMRYIRIFSELSGQLRYASQKRVLLEIAFVKLTRPSMEHNLDSVLQRLSILEKRLEEMPENLHGLMESLESGQIKESEEEKSLANGRTEKKEPGEVQPVILPKAQYEDLMLIRGEWNNIVRKMGGAIRVSLRGTGLEPAGESCLCVVFFDRTNYTIGSRESVLLELKQLVEELYKKEITFKTRLNESGEPENTIYISDEDLKVIHDDIVVED